MMPQAVMTGNATRRGRPQRRITPARALEPVYQTLGRPLALDPCSAPQSLVDADCHVMPPQDGLAIFWLWTWFMNPPYEDLGLWVRKAWLSALWLPSSGIGLLPVRPHRNYWGYVWAFPARRLCFPPAMEFDQVGAKAPFANVYVLWDARPESTAPNRFDEAFSRVGQIINLDTLTALPQSPIVRAMTQDQTQDLRAIKNELDATLERERQNAVLRTVKKHLHLNFSQFEELLEEDDLDTLKKIPVSDIVGTFPAQSVSEPVSQPSREKNGRRQAGTRKKAPLRKVTVKNPASTPKGKRAKANGASEESEELQNQIFRSVKKAGPEGITTADIVEEFSISKFMARSRLEALASEEKVELRGRTRSARWHVL